MSKQKVDTTDPEALVREIRKQKKATTARLKPFAKTIASVPAVFYTTIAQEARVDADYERRLSAEEQVLAARKAIITL